MLWRIITPELQFLSGGSLQLQVGVKQIPCMVIRDGNTVDTFVRRDTIIQTVTIPINILLLQKEQAIY